jgi:hypothetical protein
MRLLMTWPAPQARKILSEIVLNPKYSSVSVYRYEDTGTVKHRRMRRFIHNVTMSTMHPKAYSACRKALLPGYTYEVVGRVW